MAESTSKWTAHLAAAKWFTKKLLLSTRSDVRVAAGLAGGVGIWTRHLYMEEGLTGIITLLVCVFAFVMGAWRVAEIGIETVRLWPDAARFRALRGRAEQLAAEFAELAEGELDRSRFARAVSDMHRLANDLAVLDVDLEVTDTDSDCPDLVADAARENRDGLLRIAALMAEGDPDAARRR